MEKKPNRRREPRNPKTLNPKNKYLPQLNPNDVASGLIGGIVEKGINDDNINFKPIQPPQPSVLPFPVARHRSHGPHWGPSFAKKVDDDSDEEDKNVAAFANIADFAYPVHRKEKKDLNLSQWRELIPSNNSNESFPSSAGRQVKSKESFKAARSDPSRGPADPVKLNADNHQSTLISMNKAMKKESGSQYASPLCRMDLDNGDEDHLSKADRNTSCSDFKRNIESMIDHRIDKETKLVIDTVKMENGGTESHASLPDLLQEPEKIPLSYSRGSSIASGGSQNPLSLASQIDAENRAHIESMSPDEIAEAQAEIMEKIDPALLKLLKRRGQEKLKKQSCMGSGSATNVESDISVPKNQSIKEGEDSSKGKDNGYSLVRTSSQINQSREASDSMENSPTTTSSLWSTWSNRVEAIRKLRFSLDGNVVGTEFTSKAETEDSAGNRENVYNIGERDFLRTEGDPAAAGYTIKEAVALTRSVIPGQRGLSLHLLASVLHRALHGINPGQAANIPNKTCSKNQSVDWEAVWAFALGPEPELALALRMCLDDNHDSVVLACARVIQCVLSCDMNENFFENLERMEIYPKDISTAPVFRTKPEIDVGFLHGGFWKYGAKSSNVLPVGESLDEESEGNRTIQDDTVVAGQDFAAGLIRMGILLRICFLLETAPSSSLEECVLSILIAIARHSPTGANAIMECPRLVQTIVHRFTEKSSFEILPSTIKSVCLLKVLARSEKENCIDFIDNGSLRAMTWHLYQCNSSLEKWIKLGKEKCKLFSALMVEQLRLWKVCISYGYCVSYFSDIFPSMCLWMNPPALEKLVDNNVLTEFASISEETYRVLSALASRLPCIHSEKHHIGETAEHSVDNPETWSWNYVTPLMDLGMKWLMLKSDLHISESVELRVSTKFLTLQDESMGSLLWVYGAVMKMFSMVLERVFPNSESVGGNSVGSIPWLPEFVPNIGLEIIRNRFVNDSSAEDEKAESGSFIGKLCQLRLQSYNENALASVCCLHGLIEVIFAIDGLIQLAKSGLPTATAKVQDVSREGRWLHNGIVQGSLTELRSVLDIFSKLVDTGSPYIQSIEIFGRGGPAPGVGIGWGASGGGYWAMRTLLIEKDAQLAICLLKTFSVISMASTASVKKHLDTVQQINVALGACLAVSPRCRVIVAKALDILLQVPVFKFLDTCVCHVLVLSKRTKPLDCEHKEEDFIIYSRLLSSHFKTRWLSTKEKVSKRDVKKTRVKRHKRSSALETINEEVDPSDDNSEDHCSTSLRVEWVHQRLPLPTHWFLSSISTIYPTSDKKVSGAADLVQEHDDPLLIAKAGLFFILGLEAMSCAHCSNYSSPVQLASLVWKLHSLSAILLLGMDVLEDQKSRDIYDALQELYGQLINQARSSNYVGNIPKNKSDMEKKHDRAFLCFQSDIHDTYTTFIETLVDQYAAISYGDLTFGRQVAVYLHRYVEASVRLAAWNALSNARVLELLPPLDNCLGDAEGYLGPAEDNEDILEAYVKSWITGALDRAAVRGSLAWTLVLHHLSSFIFLDGVNRNTTLQSKLAKSLLRDCSRKQQHEKFMLDLINYNKPPSSQILKDEAPVNGSNVVRRFKILREICEGNSSLLAEVEKLSAHLVKAEL